MTLQQLNRIASRGKIEPDLPGVHSSGLVKSLPDSEQKRLFAEMRAACGGLNDEELEKLDQQCQLARRRCDDLEEQLKRAQETHDKLNETRVVEINRRLAEKGHI
jgi:hypothetical protein